MARGHSSTGAEERNRNRHEILWHQAALACWLLTGVTQCAQPIDAPPAYVEEQYLCDASHAAELDARLLACREAYARDGACRGLISYRGALDGQSVVVDAAVTSIDVIHGAALEAGQTGIAFWSRSPYFNSRFAFINVLRPAEASTVLGEVPAKSDFINLEARGGNYLGRFVHESRESLEITTHEVGFTFTTDIENGGHLDGCLHVLSPDL